MEPAALAERTVEPQFATHQRHQALADGYPQTGAPKTAGSGGLGLCKTAEDARLVLWRNTDASITHRDFHRDGRRLAPHHRK